MKRNTFSIFLHFLQRLAERIKNNIYSTSKKLFFRNFRGEGFRIFLRYVSFITVQHEIAVIRTARTVDCKSDKSARMTLLQFLKYEKRGATKNSIMGTRVEMWGNDLWSISVMKRNRKTSERSRSHKLAMLIFFVCLFVCNVVYDFNKKDKT